MNKNHYLWIIPLLAFILFAPFTPALDLQITRVFFNDGHFSTHPFFNFIYDYGYLPAFALTGLSFALFCGSYLIEKWIPWRKASLYVFLVSLVGIVFIVHFAFKDHWGRPRPRQTIEFGGKQPFREFYNPYFGNPIKSKSFPCGHCSGGFYFFALIFVGRRFNIRWLYYSGIFLTLILGFSLSLSRIAQGGHFLSDDIASALIMWLTALFLDWAMFSKKREKT